MHSDYDPLDPIAMFDDLFPGECLFELARGIRKAYGASEGKLKDLDDTEAKDARPHMRRAYIETAIRHAAEKHPEAGLLTGRNGANNCSHRGIVCNGILLTGSLVDDRERLPRQALYRSGYARSRQGFLPFAEHPSNAKTLLYAVVTHAPDRNDVENPAFIDILFPCRDYIDIVGRIRIIEDRFPAEFDRVAAATVEQIPDIVVPRLRPAAAQRDAQA